MCSAARIPHPITMLIIKVLILETALACSSEGGQTSPNLREDELAGVSVATMNDSGLGPRLPNSPVIQDRLPMMEDCISLASPTGTLPEDMTKRWAEKMRGMTVPTAEPDKDALVAAAELVVLTASADVALAVTLAAILEPTAAVVEVMIAVVITAESTAVVAAMVMLPADKSLATVCAEANASDSQLEELGGDGGERGGTPGGGADGGGVRHGSPGQHGVPPMSTKGRALPIVFSAWPCELLEPVPSLPPF